MAHTVTIRGSISPAAGVLERGEVKTVDYTARVQGWIDRGYVDLISESLDVDVDLTPEVVAELKADKPPTEPNASASKEE